MGRTFVRNVIYARVAQLDRAFGYEPKGREFESCHARIENRITFVIRFSILSNIARFELAAGCLNLPEFERERAECGVLLTSDEITKSKHADTFNASEQDNLATRE